jgi:hypothetical protein
MSSRIFFAPENLDWKKAYTAAVLEKDRARIPRLIQEAVEKLSDRLRQLWAMGPVPSEEMEAIHDAFICLRPCGAACRTGITLASGRGRVRIIEGICSFSRVQVMGG